MWSSCKQPIIALLTAEAEYIALTVTIQEILYISLLTSELYDISTPSIPIYSDNQAAIALASNSKFHARTKHIDLCYHFVCVHIKNGLFKLYYCPTDDNIADALTRPLVQPRLQKLRTMMGLDNTRGGVLDIEDKIQ